MNTTNVDIPPLEKVGGDPVSVFVEANVNPPKGDENVYEGPALALVTLAWLTDLSR